VGTETAPVAGFDPALAANAVFSEALVRVAMVVKPKAAAAVATTFTFPLVLMIAVLLFLLAQGFLDRRDPKLRKAPRSTADVVIEFKEEERL
jgi:hypothetical protein